MKADFSPVAGGPSHRLLARVGMARGDARGIVRTATILALVTWVPLLLLSFMQGLAFGHTAALPFFRDVAAHTRLLLAIPLLLIAELVVGPQLATVVRQLLDARIVAPEDHGAFEAAVDEIARRRDSRTAELVVLAAAYTMGWTATYAQSAAGVSTWIAREGGQLTFAGLWYLTVSLPVFLFLLLRWIWRGIVWTRFLGRVARLDLRLVATHPDGAGGLGFVGACHTGFAIVTFACSAVLSAAVGFRLMYAGDHITDFKAPIAAFVILLVALVFGPLLVFVRPLGAARRKALFRYSRMLTAHNRAFETRWLDDRDGAGEELIGNPDASSLADLGAAFDAIGRMGTVPVDRNALLTVVVATVLPILPAIALEVPMRDIVLRIVGALT